MRMMFFVRAPSQPSHHSCSQVSQPKQCAIKVLQDADMMSVVEITATYTT